MNKEVFNEELFSFINESTCSFTCIETIKNTMIKEGYKQLYENTKWNLTSGKYFVIRNDASIIVFNIGKKHNNCFNIITTHSDTPGFYLKPQNEMYENGYLKLNVSVYGGILNYGWMDRPLSLAGRIILKENNKYFKKIIDISKPLCVIPSVAIHQNANANTNLDLNTQIDLIPIISLQNKKEIIRELLIKKLNVNSNLNICDYDLFLYNTEKPMYIGTDKEMILSPRIDDLTCTFSAYKSFIEANNEENINIMCIFNSEEIGSMTKEGADSGFLLDTLKRITASLEIDISVALHNSLIISADNSHGTHPNHPEKSDMNNQILLNKGVLIIRENDTTTDSISASIFKEICKRANVPFQIYTARNDTTSGSTLSGINVRHVSIDSIDVGLPQLAMHSAMEVIGSDDTYYLYKAFKKFYDISIISEPNSIEICDKNINI